jgi:hypothetical protein
MPKKKKITELIITELFLVKADWERTFIGEIRRETDVDGCPVVMGKVIVQEGLIWSKASNQRELMKNMDDICKMKLDMGLHSNVGVQSKKICEDIFLN